MASGSTYSVNNITYHNNLSRPSTAKGTILANNGTGDFELVTPSTDCQVLTSNPSVSAGVEWQSTTQNSGLAFYNVGTVNIRPTTSPKYFLVDQSDFGPIPLVVPDCTAFFMSISPRSSVGWAQPSTTLNGGSAQFTIGYVPPNTSNIPSNWIAYPGGPHFTVFSSDINSNSDRFSTFTVPLNISITGGHQLSFRYESTITSASTTSYGPLNILLLCRGV